jgi:hypothetical protein
MKKSPTRITLLLLSLSVAVLVQAKDFWQKKDYKNWSEKECRKLLQDSPWTKTYAIWSEKECRKLLQDSPWTKTYAIGDTVIELFETQRTDRAREANPRISYTAQFRSALPIRQAEVRMARMQMNYEELPEEQRTAFDQQAGQYLDASFPDSVLVRVAFGANVPIYDMELLRHWQTITLEQLENTTYLIGANKLRVRPTAYQPPQEGKRECVLTFPRRHEETPLATPKDKRVSLEFEHPTIGELGGAPRLCRVLGQEDGHRRHRHLLAFSPLRTITPIGRQTRVNGAMRGPVGRLAEYEHQQQPQQRRHHQQNKHHTQRQPGQRTHRSQSPRLLLLSRRQLPLSLDGETVIHGLRWTLIPRRKN